MDDDQCKNLREFYEGDEVLELMRRKSVHPYQYMDNWGKFEEAKLTTQNAFYSKLNLKGISDQDYEQAQEVWNRIKPALNVTFMRLP